MNPSYIIENFVETCLSIVQPETKKFAEEAGQLGIQPSTKYMHRLNVPVKNKNTCGWNMRLSVK